MQPERAVLVATLAAPLPADDAARRRRLGELARHAEVLEVRADLVGDLDGAALAAEFPGRLLYTLRSRAEGGAFEGSPERRRERLLRAAEQYPLIDLEADRDLDPALLAAVAAERRVLSWHGAPEDAAALERRFSAMVQTPARLYKLVVFAAHSGEEVAPLLLAAALRRPDLLAFAAGRCGTWTRFIAPYCGARVIFGAAGEAGGETGADAAVGAPGQLTVDELVADYGLPELPRLERVFGIVGDPVVGTSLSPRLHNAAYRELGLPCLYLPFETSAFGDFWLEVVESGVFERLGLTLGGLSVTAPHKAGALAVAGAASPLVECINAANTLVRREGVWEAESTDPQGVLGPLAERGFAVAGRLAAVVGCGGAGRSAAVGLVKAGAQVTLVNRSIDNGEAAGEALDLPFVPLAAFEPREFDLVVQATPLGRGAGEPLPFAVDELPAGAAVVDLVYRTGEPTPVVAAARRRGLVAVDGREVLLHQAMTQFLLMTGRELPQALARRLLGLAEPGSEGLVGTDGRAVPGESVPGESAPGESAPSERTPGAGGGEGGR